MARVAAACLVIRRSALACVRDGLVLGLGAAEASAR
jgi:hypothetical protein